MFTSDELRAAYLALDYIDTNLESVDTRPPHWTEKKYTAAFCSAYDKCVGKLPADFTVDELTVMYDALALRLLLHPGSPEGSAAEAAVMKIRRILDNKHPSP